MDIGVSASASSQASAANGPIQFGNVAIGGASSNQTIWIIAALAVVAVFYFWKK